MYEPKTPFKIAKVIFKESKEEINSKLWLEVNILFFQQIIEQADIIVDKYMKIRKTILINLT